MGPEATPTRPHLHPPSDLLLDWVSGQIPSPSLRLLVEAHVDLCPTCEAAVAELEQPGATLLGALQESAHLAATWSAISARIAAEPGPSLPGPLPPSLRGELAGRDLRWLPLPFSRARLAVLDRNGDERTLLLHLGERRRLPRHRHLGSETLLVLAGGYTDRLGHFDAGCWAEYGTGSEHGPVTDSGETCWVLTRIVGSVRFLGARGALMRLLGVR